MPRRITTDFSFDECEDEVLFTRAALKADPDATDLLPSIDGWLSLIDTARTKDREARAAIGEASALRAVSNGRLDDACRSFGDDLHLAVKKDHQAARYRRFFPRTVGTFVKQRLASQVAAVRAWLGTAGDDVLDKHHAELERWAAAVQAALDATVAGAQTRGLSLVARESLAEDLTRERDGLEAGLVARAHERGLARDWPARFFRTESRRAASGDPTPAPPSPAPSSAGAV
jgi:hypothetical protein